MSFIKRFAGNDQGATAIEYGLIAGFIALAIITVVTMTGQSVLALWEQILGIFN